MTDTSSSTEPETERDLDLELDSGKIAQPNSQRSAAQRLLGQLGRLRKPPRQIFANGRIYGRIRISTVAVTVVFLAVLWVYLQVRPPPTVPTPPNQTTQQDVGTSTTKVPTPTTTEDGSESATPTPTPTGTDSAETTGSTSPAPGDGTMEDGAGRGERSPAAEAPTSTPPDR